MCLQKVALIACKTKFKRKGGEKSDSEGFDRKGMLYVRISAIKILKVKE